MSASDSSRSVRSLAHVHRNTEQHWVGDGFPVRTLFAYSDGGAELSPFLLFDYAGPRDFPPTTRRLGVGEHPHRGFETVTIVYDGVVEHRDSSGGGGRIGPGDVQWMTAASGIVHEEFHGRDFARDGGRFHMVQLWVNLPAKDKMKSPRYQSILDADIPAVDLPDGRGTVRVIAGAFDGAIGPAQTFTPMDVWDVRLRAGHHVELPVPDGHTVLLAVLDGAVHVDGGGAIGPAEVGVFERTGNFVILDVEHDTTALVLSGDPIDEPIVGHGPFVMNTVDEIRQALADYRSGRMGHLG
ncbi:MAG: pirin family protein [Acidobacteria bacterium]|nr:pirin family protein [Acidobacteriota bacterium]